MDPSALTCQQVVPPGNKLSATGYKLGTIGDKLSATGGNGFMGAPASAGLVGK